MAIAKTVNIYTDGGCAGNQNDENYGGWGAILEYGDYKREAFGGEVNTTNNRMELTAFAVALEMLKKDNLSVMVFSDSSYLIKCMNDKWYLNWEKNGWKNSQKNPVENRDLWERIIAHLPNHKFKFFHVKGHVELDNKKTDVEGHYNKFLKNNGNHFNKEQFIYITKMNNRADELANKGIDSVRLKT